LKKSKKDIFRVKLNRKAEKFLEKLSESDRRRIIETLRALRTDPFSLDIKKLEGTEFHRVRVGRFRIILYIDWESAAIVVLKIDKRERVYSR
jgi:mRNA interferase RelE/StbE